VNKKSDSVYVNYGGMVAVERPITLRNVQRVYVAICLPGLLLRERECTSSRRGGGPCDDGGGEEGKKRLSRRSHPLRPFKYARRELCLCRKKDSFREDAFPAMFDDHLPASFFVFSVEQIF
jgi:hypothetical protein